MTSRVQSKCIVYTAWTVQMTPKSCVSFGSAFWIWPQSPYRVHQESETNTNHMEMVLYLVEYVQTRKFLRWKAQYLSQDQSRTVYIYRSCDWGKLWAIPMDAVCARIEQGIEWTLCGHGSSSTELYMAWIAAYGHDAKSWECRVMTFCPNILENKCDEYYKGYHPNKFQICTFRVCLHSIRHLEFILYDCWLYFF